MTQKQTYKHCELSWISYPLNYKHILLVMLKRCCENEYWKVYQRYYVHNSN